MCLKYSICSLHCEMDSNGERLEYLRRVRAARLLQRRRIIAAAEAWLAGRPNDVNSDMRFDVVLVAPKSMPRHIVAAFDASNASN